MGGLYITAPGTSRSRTSHQFQWWALDKLGAQPVAGKKKGSDKGIDGVIPFFASNAPGKSEYARAIVSVKGGEHAGVGAIRDLKGVLDREKSRSASSSPSTRPRKT